MDFINFLREKRATILIGGGMIIIFFWFIMMTSYDLFTLSPFGNGIGMGWTLLIAIILAPVLLFATYWGGSDDSPIDGPAHSVARFIYVAFKNYMIVLAIFTLVLGMPRLKYYQLRAGDHQGPQLSYYEQRTLFNLFRQGTYILDSTSSQSEDVSEGIGVVPMGDSQVDSGSSSSSSSSSKSDNDGWGKIFEALCSLLIFLVAVLVVIYFFGLVILSIIYVDFWLVAIVCIAIGMICLGIIDIHDGPYV